MSFIGAFSVRGSRPSEGIRLPSGGIVDEPTMGALPDSGRLKHVVVIDFNR
jgi:hypothetical protein